MPVRLLEQKIIEIDVPKWWQLQLWLPGAMESLKGVPNFIPLIFCGVAQGFSWAEDCSLSAISRQDSRPHATGLRYSQLYKWHHWMFWVWRVWYGWSQKIRCITTVENGIKWIEGGWIDTQHHSTTSPKLNQGGRLEQRDGESPGRGRFHVDFQLHFGCVITSL